MGCKVWGGGPELGVGVQGLGSRVWGAQNWGLGFKVEGLGFGWLRIWQVGLRL